MSSRASDPGSWKSGVVILVCLIVGSIAVGFSWTTERNQIIVGAIAWILIVTGFLYALYVLFWKNRGRRFGSRPPAEQRRLKEAARLLKDLDSE